MFHQKILSSESLDDIARQLLDAFPDKRIFAFYGEMGAGKTTFIKALCRALHVSDVTSSPSFGLIHEYHTGEGNSVFHFDFYRIETVEEVFDIGYEEYMFSGDYCFLEWPEMVESILPEDTVRLAISVAEGGIRELQELV
jgi:tRNA threonylcarbamoyladenosine biosynthesis protein TsaE